MKINNLANAVLYSFILVICALLLLLLVAGKADAHAAAPAQAPYLDGCVNGICTVYWPGVPGYDSGYLVVLNTCTRESGALYLIWQSDHTPGRGEYKTDIRQLFRMGSCTYVVTDGRLGYQEIYLPSWAQVFTFRVWQSWLAVMR